MAPLYQLDDTLGSLFVGNLLTTALWGATCMQVYFYCMNYWNKDRPLIKCLVMVVAFCDTLHQVLTSVAVYDYSIRNWGNPTYLMALPWTLVIEIMPVAAIIWLSQGFMIGRIYRLSMTRAKNRNILKAITGALFTSITSEFVILLVWVIKGMTFDSLLDLQKINHIAFSRNVIGAANDIIIAGVLSYLLHTSKTGFQKSASIINKCIAYSINCGSLTALFTVLALIAIEVRSDAFIYAIFFWTAGKLYANALLATLNVRNYIRSRGDLSSPFTGFSADIAQLSSVADGTEEPHTQGQSRKPNLTVRIDTETMRSSGNGVDSIRMEDIKAHDHPFESST